MKMGKDIMQRFRAINIFKLFTLRQAALSHKSSPPIPPQVFQDPRYFIAFGLGSGAVPFAPGTFGTLMAIPFYYLTSSLNIYIYALLVLLFILASMLLCHRLSQETHTHDHPGMCIDEFAGFFVTMIGIPMASLGVLIAGFLLFRFFDIVKPWPISWVDQHVHGGVGMVLDDVLAGLVSCFILHGIFYIF